MTCSGRRVGFTLHGILALALALSCGSGSSGGIVQRQASPEVHKPAAKNVIVMIADGSGYNHIDAASFYLAGVERAQAFESFPFRFAVSTYSTDGWGYDPALAWSDFDYVKSHYTDAAAGGTALATGVKTYDAAIGVDALGNPVENLVERAEGLGRSTGVVTTLAFSHAVTAAFSAHNLTRDDYEGIAREMLLTSGLDVIMGAGHPWFDNDGQPRATPNTYKYVGGQATWDALVAGTAAGDADGDGIDDPWTLIEERGQFQSLASGAHPKRVVGVAHAYTTLQQARSGDAMADPYVVPPNDEVPTLVEMTQAALNVLDDDPDGFVLLVVGGAIDWASHSHQAGRIIEEQLAFHDALGAAAAWVEAHSNWGETLLLVTSTHEVGYLTGPGSNPLWKPIVNNGAGSLPGMEFHSTNHTNSLVPLYAKGAAAHLLIKEADLVDPVRGKYLDNTEIGQVLLETLGPR